MREFTTGLDREVGQTCRLLRLNWTSVLSLDRARALAEASVREEEPSRETDLQESEDEYSHAEHYNDKAFSLHDGSDSEYEVHIEGNDAWQGGCIVGYSSDGDFS